MSFADLNVISRHVTPFLTEQKQSWELVCSDSNGLFLKNLFKNVFSGSFVVTWSLTSQQCVLE